MKTQTQPVLIPPPPIPPGRVAAGQFDDARQPSRRSASFLFEVWCELRHIKWPHNEIGAIGATIVFLMFFAALISGASALADSVLRAFGL